VIVQFGGCTVIQGKEQLGLESSMRASLPKAALASTSILCSGVQVYPCFLICRKTPSRQINSFNYVTGNSKWEAVRTGSHSTEITLPRPAAFFCAFASVVSSAWKTAALPALAPG
jgi:hypothetical protein